MPKYHVVLILSNVIRYLVEAESEDNAKELVLNEQAITEELISGELEVESVELVKEK